MPWSVQAELLWIRTLTTVQQEEMLCIRIRVCFDLPGATLSSAPAFNGTWNGANAPPTTFMLNGAAHTVV
jgi:hypothetical protein